MATLPRSAKYPPGPAVLSLQPDFDTGINTSTAWTEHLETGAPTVSLSKARTRKFLSESDAVPSLSEEETEDEPEVLTRPARALFAFEGKAEFRELQVEAGDELEVIKEDVGDGWSLVKDSTGEVGLLPKTYYTVCFLEMVL